MPAAPPTSLIEVALPKGGKLTLAIRKRSIFRTLATAVDFEQRSELIFMQQPVVPVGDRLGRGLIDVDRLQLA